MPRKSLVFAPVQQGLLLFFLFSFLTSGRAAAQAAAESPSTVLKEALTAACSQNSTEFVRSLTVRNAEAFGRMTPPARETFLKRFVLLDKPGKPRVQNEASGNFVVFCETSDVTTQMEIAKPELRDNLAYLPLIVKDSTDSAGLNAHHVTMGMVREAGQWKILSLGLLFLTLIPGSSFPRNRVGPRGDQGQRTVCHRLSQSVGRSHRNLPQDLYTAARITEGAGPRGEKHAKKRWRRPGGRRACGRA